MLFWISLVCLVIAALSFLAFLFFLFGTRAKAPPLNELREQSEMEGLAKVGEALAKLVDSLNKAGPATLTLTASMVFMVMALIAAKG